MWAEGWFSKLAAKFHRPAQDLGHFDLQPIMARGCDLLSDIADAFGGTEEQLWAATRLCTQLRFASFPPGLLCLLLNVWPTAAAVGHVAGALGLPKPDPGCDWAYGLPQVVVGLVRTGYTNQSGLLAKAGYGGEGARKGLLNTMHRLVLVPRPGSGMGEPLLVLAAINPGDGISCGSCHAPAAAVVPGTDPEGTAANWVHVLETAAQFLRGRQQPTSPVVEAECQQVPALKAVRAVVRDSSRQGYESDHVRVGHMEVAVGVPLFTLCNLEGPFPDSLFD